MAILKRAIAELKAKLVKRSTFGSTSHPTEMEVDDISHTIEDVEVDEKGTAIATVRVLPTTKGRNLAAILRGGGALGVSARGFGDTKNGVVQDNYKLAGLDFVLNPSFDTYVDQRAMFESRSEETDGVVTLEDLKAMGLVEEPKKELTEAEKEIKIQKGFNQAIASGFRGDLQSYRDSFNQTAEDRLVNQRFDDAVKASGFKGTLDQFKKGLTKGK